MLKKCNRHGLAEHFKRKDGAFRCGKCASEWVMESRRNKKDRLVKMFGGRCIKCGYNKYSGALDFHHGDSSKKDFSLSVKGLCYSWNTVVKEAEKCVLLCKNCHAEVGAGRIKLKI